jgi:uncharacterized membrane protein HdeD (DUF308 family)
MNESKTTGASTAQELQESRARARTLLPIEGSLLLFLGVAAIVMPGLAAVVVTMLLGCLFFLSGAVGFIITLGARHAPGFWWSLVSAIAALVAGTVLTIWPSHDPTSIRLVLGLYLAVDGIFSLMYAIAHRRQLPGRWAWMLASGIFTMMLAAYILAENQMELATFGVLVGIDMLLAGAALVAIGTGLGRDLDAGR